MNYINKVFVTLFMLVAFVLPEAVLAATSLNGDPQDYATLRVTNSNTNGSPTESWVSSTSGRSGETISFAIYYHNTGSETARNVRVRLTSPGSTERNSHTLQATVWADNASAVTGSATVSIVGGAESLQFLGVRWYPNQTQGAQTSIPSGQTGSNIFNSQGLLIGDIAPGWSTQGSVVVGFQISQDNNNDITPTVNITASPSSINRGNSSRLTWNSSNADSCYATSGWSGNKSVDGSQTVYPNNTTTYTIVCENGNRTAQDSVTVYVDDYNNDDISVDLYASPTSISRGGQSRLNWSSQGADYCTASGGWSGSRSTSGSLYVYPEYTQTYYLTCYRDGNQASDGATVYVDNYGGNVSVDLIASPSSINSGQSSQLTWNSSNADSCYATGGWSGNKSVDGSQYVYPVTTTTYTINCTANGGYQSSDTVTVYVNNTNYNGDLFASCVASPASVNTNQTVTFAVAGSGGRPGYTYTWSGAVDGSASVMSRSFTTTGVKTAYVTVRDQDGRTAQATCSTSVTGSTYTPPTYTPPVKPTPPKEECQTIKICSTSGNVQELANQLRFCAANVTNNNGNPIDPSFIPPTVTPDDGNNQGAFLGLGSFWGTFGIFLLFALVVAILIALILYFFIRREERY